MDAEIKKEIEEILEQINGLVVYVLTKDNKVKLMNIDENGIENIKILIEEKLKKLLIEEEIFFTFDKYEIKNTYCVIDKKDYKKFNEITKLKGDVDYFLDEPENVKGYIYVFGNDNRFITLYEKAYNISLIKSKGNVLQKIFDSDNCVQYKTINECLFKLSANYQIMILEDKVITNKVNILEQDFEFKEYINRESDRIFNNVKALNIINDYQKINEYIEEEKYKKRIIKAKNSPIFKMKENVLFKNIKQSKEYKNKIKIENDKIIIDTKKSFENFLVLLNDDLLNSSITAISYDIKSKEISVEE